MPKEDIKEFTVRFGQKCPGFDTRGAWGQQNSSAIVGNGFLIGVYNFEKFDLALYGPGKKYKGLGLLGCYVLPPHNTVFYGIQIESGLDQLNERLAVLAKEQQGGGKKNNNVRLYLSPASPGNLWAINEYVEELDPGSSGKPIPVSAVTYAKVTGEGTASDSELDFIDYLKKLSRPERVNRIYGQEVAKTIPQGYVDLPFDEIRKRIEGLGGYFSEDLLKRYHLSMSHLKHKHFVFLTGISGTGKTLLARLYARAVHNALDLTQEDPAFFTISVRPDWTDPSSFVGYYDAINSGFARTTFTDALVFARNNPELPVFVCIDEMNLARVEYYLADILSAMESSEAIELHPLEEADANGKPYKVPGRMKLPSNLYITGTVNLDETTHEFSPKVLDRASVIDMSGVDITGYLKSLAEKDGLLGAPIGGLTGKALLTVHATLAPYGMHFGYRVARETVEYVARSLALKIFPEAEALDQQLVQKVLTKLKGDHNHSQMLEVLEKSLNGLPLSLGIVKRMQDDLVKYDSFQF